MSKENINGDFEKECQNLRIKIKKCTTLQREFLFALQSLKRTAKDLMENEAGELCSMLCHLATQLLELFNTDGKVQEDNNNVLICRYNALNERYVFLQLTICYLGQQVANLAINSFAASKLECREALAVGICTLARELKQCSVANRKNDEMLLYRATCPVLLVPVRKLTLTRILQLCAANRAEYASKAMLTALIPHIPTALKVTTQLDQTNSEKDAEDYDSGTSMEVARELLRYASPPRGVGVALNACVANEQKLAVCILAAVREHASQLAGESGEILLAQRDSRSKVLTYYRQLLWGDAGTIADHVLLWWTRPLGDSVNSVSLLKWLNKIKGEAGTSASCAINALCEALSAHHATVSWDALFRRALVAPSGAHFSNLFTALIRVLNSVSVAVEQIPLLHRLDHSLHTYRLWILTAARHHVGAWRLKQFVDISQRDVALLIIELKKLILPENALSPPIDCVHETVCVRMRSKLVSEVKENLLKLEKAPEECIKVMAAVCRTVSLANLHMCFPERQYWRRDGPIPQYASAYVEQYLERVLRPVLMAISERPIEAQQQVGGMALRIICEAWLDHIYELRVRFSEWGALQLLADFGAVPTWLQERASLHSSVERSLVRSDVLRRCEGVGRLLLRRPGEALQLHDNTRIRVEQDENATPVKDSMPAEMYVPNQEKWLELRARRPAGVAAAAAILCCR